VHITSTLARSDIAQYSVKKNIIELSRKDFRRVKWEGKKPKRNEVASVYGAYALFCIHF